MKLQKKNKENITQMQAEQDRNKKRHMEIGMRIAHIEMMDKCRFRFDVVALLMTISIMIWVIADRILMMEGYLFASCIICIVFLVTIITCTYRQYKWEKSRKLLINEIRDLKR